MKEHDYKEALSPATWMRDWKVEHRVLMHAFMAVLQQEEYADAEKYPLASQYHKVAVPAVKSWLDKKPKKELTAAIKVADQALDEWYSAFGNEFKSRKWLVVFRLLSNHKCRIVNCFISRHIDASDFRLQSHMPRWSANVDINGITNCRGSSECPVNFRQHGVSLFHAEVVLIGRCDPYLLLVFHDFVMYNRHIQPFG